MIHFHFPGELWVPLFLTVLYFSLRGTHWPAQAGTLLSGGSTSWHGCTGHAGARKVQDPRGILLLHVYCGPSDPILATFAESPLFREDLYSSDIEELNKVGRGGKDYYSAL